MWAHQFISSSRNPSHHIKPHLFLGWQKQTEHHSSRQPQPRTHFLKWAVSEYCVCNNQPRVRLLSEGKIQTHFFPLLQTAARLIRKVKKLHLEWCLHLSNPDVVLNHIWTQNTAQRHINPGINTFIMENINILNTPSVWVMPHALGSVWKWLAPECYSLFWSPQPRTLERCCLSSVAQKCV